MSIDTYRCRKPGLQSMVPTLALLILLGAGCSEKDATTPESGSAQAPAPQVAEPEMSPPAMAPEPAAESKEPQGGAESPAADMPADTQTAAVDGQKIFQGSCQACHVAGVAGAPKLGDKEAWAPRIAKGNDALLSSVKSGLNAMPPMGACMSCSEEDLRAAIAYMVGQGS